MFRHSLLKPHGVTIVTGPDIGRIEMDTKQCVHCGGHWIIVKGSGRPHVFCSRCNGDTCSNVRCLTTCYPVQKMFDDIEKFGHEVRPR